MRRHDRGRVRVNEIGQGRGGKRGQGGNIISEARGAGGGGGNIMSKEGRGGHLLHRNGS